MSVIRNWQAAFDKAYLQEHGVYPAACDLPEHLIGVDSIEQEQDDFDPNGPFDDPVPALSFDWDLDDDGPIVTGDTWLDMVYDVE